MYSADEGSPPLVNGKSAPHGHRENLPALHPVTAQSSQIRQTARASAAPPRSAPPVPARGFMHGRASLRLPTFKKRSTFRDDTFHGAYTNPNVRKMIDVQYDSNENQ